MRMGLSSTGMIRLIGVYRQAGGKEEGEEVPELYHFLQQDLGGSRLFWSVLVDPVASTAEVLYDINAKPGKEKKVISTKDSKGPKF